MKVEPPSSDQLAEVARLATTIADRILDLHSAGTSIPPEQFRMLVSAAQMLQANAVPWPTPVETVLMEVAKRARQEHAPGDSGSPSAGDGVRAGLANALGSFRREQRLEPQG